MMYRYFGHYENVYFATTFLFCIGIFITSAEYLYIHKEFKLEGVFSWKVFSSRPDYLNNAFLKKFDFVFGYGGFLSIQVLRILCCTFLPLVGDSSVKAVLVSLIAISSLAFSFRNIVGNDGSDQMNSVICITLFISYLCHDVLVFKIGL